MRASGARDTSESCLTSLHFGNGPLALTLEEFAQDEPLEFLRVVIQNTQVTFADDLRCRSDSNHLPKVI